MFGPRIKAMRLEQGLRQRQLAELLGTDMPMYSKMELGARRVRRDQVPKLAELYKVDEKELMTLWLADGVYAALGWIVRTLSVSNDLFSQSHKIAKSGRKCCRTQNDCLRIVYADMKKALARNS